MSDQSRARKRECRVLRPRSFLLSAIITLLLIAERRGLAEEPNLIPISLESAGARYGFPANNQARGLQEAEVFANYYLPYLWEFGRLEVQSRLDATVCWIGGHSKNAFMGMLG